MIVLHADSVAFPVAFDEKKKLRASYFWTFTLFSTQPCLCVKIIFDWCQCAEPIFQKNVDCEKNFFSVAFLAGF